MSIFNNFAAAWALVANLESFLALFGGIVIGVIAGAIPGMSATMAVALTGMSVFKITGYTLNGFDYRPYFLTIALAVLAAFAGTWVGKAIIDRISETTFRFVFRALVTLTAIRLLYTSIANS